MVTLYHICLKKSILLTLQAYIETRNDEKLVISLPKELERRVYN